MNGALFRMAPDLSRSVYQQPGTHLNHQTGSSGGRTWWAHGEFTRINIEPTILRKKIEDVREAGASKSCTR